MLRSSVVRSAGPLQPMLFRAAICPYSTTVSLMVSPKSNSKPRAPPTLTPTTTIRFYTTPMQQQQQQQHRNASSTTRRPQTDNETDAAAAEAAAARQAAAYSSSSSTAPLDWNTFFQLRKTRRRLQQTFSVVGALGGGVGGALFLSTGAAESVVGKIPLDPFVTLGLMTFSFAALGWLIGPVLGTTVFNLFKRQVKAQMALKESQFFVRIKKHRVDPTSSSMNNPGIFSCLP